MLDQEGVGFPTSGVGESVEIGKRIWLGRIFIIHRRTLTPNYIQKIVKRLVGAGGGEELVTIQR